MARIIVFLIFGGFGFVMLYVGVTQYWLQRRLLSRAEPIDAEITHSAVFTSTSSDTDASLQRNTSTTSHRADVKFRYAVNGEIYESDLLHPNIIVRGYASRDAAAEALVPYPVGARVRAFVDPGAPSKAFLIAEAGRGPIVFIVIGVVLPPLAWWAGQWA